MTRAAVHRRGEIVTPHHPRYAPGVGPTIGEREDARLRQDEARTELLRARAEGERTRAAASHERRLRSARPPMPAPPQDAAPASSGPQGSPEGKGARKVQRTAQRASRGTDRAYGRIRRSATKTGSRRMLLAELVVMLVATAVIEISETHEAPSPGAFVAPVVVFLVLGLVSDFSPGAARVATALGGVMILTLLLAHSEGIIEALQAVAGARGGGGTKHASNR